MLSITIFTPTYNRADLLPRLYKSLCEQRVDFGSNSDSPLYLPHKGENADSIHVFEWLIVDDGSSDNTEEVVQGFMAEQRIPIRYYKKPNGGKHTAINYGAKVAKGELFFIADSDDYLPKDSVTSVINVYSTIKGNPLFAGLCGLDAYENGKIIGSGLPIEYIDSSTLDISDKYGVRGDLKEVFLTSVIQNYPFPEIDGERFCPEVLVWNRIGKKYKLRYFNKVIYIAEYQKEGITAGITRARMNSPIASMLTYSEWVKYDVPFKKKFKMTINYWRFAFCSNGHFLHKLSQIGIASLFLLPISFFMHLIDRRKFK